MKAEETKILITNVSLNYVAILEPKAGPSGGEPRYSVQMRIKKDAPGTKDTLAKIAKAMTAAFENGKAQKWGGKNPDWNECKKIIHDGDKIAASGTVADAESYKGYWVLSANSKTKPGVIDQSGLDLTQPGHTDDIYSGMIATVSVNFFPFSGAKKGIACGLNNIMKTAEGTYAGGRASAQSDFADLINEPAPASEEPSKTEGPKQLDSIEVADDDLPF